MVLQRHPGIPLTCVLSTARHCHSAKDVATHQRLCGILARRFGQHLLDIKNNQRCSQFTTLCNAYLSLSYALSRLLHVILAVVAYMFVRRLLGSRDPLEIFYEATNETFTMDNITHVPYPKGGRFATVVQCDYAVRQMGNAHHHTIQCHIDHSATIIVLVFVCMWLSLVLAVNVVGLVQFVVSSVLVPCHGGGIQSALASMGVNIEDKREAQRFVSFVGWDGVLMAQFVSEVSSDAVAAEMLAGAYSLFSQSTNPEPGSSMEAPQGHIPIGTIPPQRHFPMGTIPPQQQNVSPTSLSAPLLVHQQPESMHPQLEKQPM